MNIPSRVLLSLVPICDRESSRYALGSVLVEREDDEHAVAVAADGRAVMAIRFACPVTDEASERPEMLIPADVIEAIAGRAPTKARRRALGAEVMAEQGDKEEEGQKIRLSCVRDVGRLTIEGSAEGGRFPKWRDLWPNTEDPPWPTVFVDPRRLAALLLAIADAATDDEHLAVAILANPAPGAAVAIELRAVTETTAAAALLCSKNEEALPPWCPRSNQEVAPREVSAEVAG